MSFNFAEYVTPAQETNTNTAGGDGGNGGDSHSLAFGYTAADGGNAHDRGSNPWHHAGNGGNSNGGNAYGETTNTAHSSANGGNGGDGGDAHVNAGQSTNLSNQFQNVGNEYDHSFNTEVKDSYNHDSHDTAIRDSFNHVNNGVDNSHGGSIDHSIVGGHDVSDSGNTVNNTHIDHSFNTDNSETNIDAHDDHSFYNSFNTDDHSDHLDLDISHNHVVDIL